MAAKSLTSRQRLRAAGAVVDLVAVLGCALWAARPAAGMDVSWDLLAYHHYYSWLFLNGDMHLADPETYVNRYQNPLPQLPWYLFDQVMSPRAATAAIAAVAGLNLALVRRVTVQVLPRMSEWRQFWLSVTSMVLAATGATFSMELGMSVGDVVVSLPMLAALLLTLRSMQHVGVEADARWRLGAAGALAGAAVGAKLTMMVYVVALTACVAYLSAVRHSPRPLLRFALGGVVGVGLSSGWWLLSIWRLTGNPLFPYYNTVFRSPLWPDYNVRDDRFGATGLVDGFTYPWYMAEGTRRVLDVPMRDLRWVVLLVLLVLAVASVAVWAQKKRSLRPTPAQIAFWLFFGSSALLWLFQFGIARYAVTTELLTGTALVVCLAAVLRRAVVAAAVGAVLALGMAPFNEGHFYHVPFQRDRFMVDAAPLQAVEPGAVVLADNGSAPSGFLLTYLPDGVERHIIQGWFFDTPMMGRLQERLARSRQLYVLVGPAWPRQPAARTNLRREVGVVVDDASCVAVRSTVPRRQLCKAEYVGPAPRGTT